ncbi:MAG: hypothetical protein KDK91_20460, partial [Gammaproteobacteria bacterium]|nr:hypothetical protein [Gammaproteobacteria bacterium]
AHLGMAVFVAGVTITSITSIETDVALKPGQQQPVDDYAFRFEGVEEVSGPNYRAQQGQVRVLEDDRTIAVLYPQKRFYSAPSQPMTEAAIDASLTRDLYVALGESLGEEAWSLRLYHKPYVRWIWLGGLLMALGGLVAASDRRYRLRLPASAREAIGRPGGTDALPLGVAASVLNRRAGEAG